MTINTAGLDVQLDIDTDEIYVCSFSPDRTRILTGAHDVPIQLWDTQTGGHVRTFQGHSDMVWALTWERGQLQFMSGAFDRQVRVWDAHSGRCIRILEGHDGYVRCVQATRDWKRALSGSGDRTIRLWNLEDGRCLRVLEGHADAVYDVAFSPDERRALSTSRTARSGSGMSKRAAACVYWRAIACTGRRSPGAKTDGARYQRRRRRSGCGLLTTVNACACFKGTRRPYVALHGAPIRSALRRRRTTGLFASGASRAAPAWTYSRAMKPV
jgi:hypothetical protein